MKAVGTPLGLLFERNIARASSAVPARAVAPAALEAVSPQTPAGQQPMRPKPVELSPSPNATAPMPFGLLVEPTRPNVTPVVEKFSPSTPAANWPELVFMPRTP